MTIHIKWSLVLVLTVVSASASEIETNTYGIATALDPDSAFSVMAQLINEYPADVDGRLNAARDLRSLSQTSRHLYTLLSNPGWCLTLIWKDMQRTPDMLLPEVLAYYACVPGTQRALKRFAENLVDQQSNTQQLVHDLFAFKVSTQSLKQAAFEQFIKVQNESAIDQNWHHLKHTYHMMSDCLKRLKAAPRLNHHTTGIVRSLINADESHLQKIRSNRYALIDFSPVSSAKYIDWLISPACGSTKQATFRIKHFPLIQEYDNSTSQFVTSENETMVFRCSFEQTADHAKTYIMAMVSRPWGQAIALTYDSYEGDHDTILLPGCLWIDTHAYLHGYTQKQSPLATLYYPTVIKVDTQATRGIQIICYAPEFTIPEPNDIELMCMSSSGLIVMGTLKKENLIVFDPVEESFVTQTKRAESPND